MSKHTPPTEALAAIWAPERPEVRVSGTFTWDGSRGTARVVGHLEELGGVSFGPGDMVRTYDVLHANLDSTNYTLVGCREQIGMMSGDEYVSSALITCRALIEGIHLASPDDLFAAVRFRLDAGDDWLGRTGLSREITWRPRVRSEVVYEAGEDDEAGTWKISDGVNTSVEEAPQSIRTTRIHAITHRPDGGLNVQQALETVRAVQRFAALCAGWLPVANNVALEHPTDTVGTNLDGSPAAVTHELFFDQDSAAAHPKPGDIPPVTLAGLGGAAVLDAWLDRHEQIRSVVSMVISQQAGEIPYLEQMFLNNALCAELLDRHDRIGVTGGDVRVDANQFAQLTAAALDAVDGDDRKELERILRYANTPPLQQRLKRLAQTADPDRSTLFVGVKHGRWAEVAMRARNALTHDDGLATGDRVDALHWVNVSLRWVVIVNALAPMHPHIAASLLTSPGAQTAAVHLGDAVATLHAHFDQS